MNTSTTTSTSGRPAAACRLAWTVDSGQCRTGDRAGQNWTGHRVKLGWDSRRFRRPAQARSSQNCAKFLQTEILQVQERQQLGVMNTPPPRPLVVSLALAESSFQSISLAQFWILACGLRFSLRFACFSLSPVCMLGAWCSRHGPLVWCLCFVRVFAVMTTDNTSCELACDECYQLSVSWILLVLRDDW